MKKLALMALVLAAATGCRGGIIDRLCHGDIFRGDACGSCNYKLPAADLGCNNCGTVGSAYGSYDGEIIDGGYYAPPVIEGGIIDGGMSTIPAN